MKKRVLTQVTIVWTWVASSKLKKRAGWHTGTSHSTSNYSCKPVALYCSTAGGFEVRITQPLGLWSFIIQASWGHGLLTRNFYAYIFEISCVTVILFGNKHSTSQRIYKIILGYHSPLFRYLFRLEKYSSSSVLESIF